MRERRSAASSGSRSKPLSSPLNARLWSRSRREKPRNNPGYDISLAYPAGWRAAALHRGERDRVAGAPTFTITKNEVLYALNKSTHYVLALVRVDGNQAGEIRYIRQPFVGSDEVLFGVTSLNVDWDEMFGDCPLKDSRLPGYITVRFRHRVVPSWPPKPSPRRGDPQSRD